MKKNRIIRLSLILAIVVTSLLGVAGVAYADDSVKTPPEESTAVMPPVAAFPDYISISPRLEKGSGMTLLSNPVWVASTDLSQVGVNVMGNHLTTSTVSIQEIWADGYMKYQGSGWWGNTNSQHTSGTMAQCYTWMTAVPLTSYYGETRHHCYQPGYEVWNPITADTCTVYL